MDDLEQMRRLVKKLYKMDATVPHLEMIVKLQAKLIEELVRVAKKTEEEIASLRVRAEKLESQ